MYGEHFNTNYFLSLNNPKCEHKLFWVIARRFAGNNFPPQIWLAISADG